MRQPQHNFSVGSVKRLILSQALPLTVAQTVQLLYNIVDRVYIGHLEEIGDLALTGLGITFPVIVIISAFTNLFASGGVTLFSIARGKGNTDEAEQLIGSVCFLLLVTSAVLFSVCYTFHRPLLFLFGASDQSYPYAGQYLKIYLLGTAFSMLSTGLNGFINSQGFPRIGMLTTVIGALLNIILDPIFIFVLHLGIRGAAIATVLSQTISFIWVIRFLTGKTAILRLKRKHLSVDIPRLKGIIALGLPGFVMQGTNSLVQIVCNNQLQLYGGDLYVGIMTILNSVREMVSVPITGIGHGAQPILGYNYGAGKNERVKEGIRFSTILGAIYLTAAWIIIMLIPSQLIGIFSDETATIVQGAEMLLIYFYGFVFMTFQSAGQTAFQALGKSKYAIFFSLLRKAIIVVPLTLLLPAVGFGVKGVFLAEPISNVVGGLAAFITMWFTVYRKL